MSHRNFLDLKNANKKDSKLLFDWSNDKLARNNSLSNKKILINDHNKWFNSELLNKNSYIWICIINNNPCGLIRFKKKNNRYTLSYLISPAYRGNNYSKPMIQLAINKFKSNKPRVKNIYAQVLTNNNLSIKILKSLGFKFKSISKNGLVHLLYFALENK